MKKTWRIRLEWKLQDLWVGVYWDNDYLGRNIWICLVPCVPIHVWSFYDVIEPALTGTGEKHAAALEDIARGGNRPVDELRSIAAKALAGRTGNNKQKGE